MIGENDLGKRVRVGDIEGEIVAHSISPQVLIQTDDGQKIWRRDVVCEIIPDKPELKPCPFCGSEEVECFTDDTHDYYYINCGKCHVGVRWYKTMDETIKKWNTRLLLEYNIKMKPLFSKVKAKICREAYDKLIDILCETGSLSQDVSNGIEKIMEEMK